MKEVTYEEYEEFKGQHGVTDNTCMSVIEQFPDGSSSKLWYMGVNRRVKMCLAIVTNWNGDMKHSYYIY